MATCVKLPLPDIPESLFLLLLSLDVARHGRHVQLFQVLGEDVVSIDDETNEQVGEQSCHKKDEGDEVEGGRITLDDKEKEEEGLGSVMR